MRHTFIMEEGLWVAKGIYFDSNNNRFFLEGSAKFTHGENKWINESYMTLLTPDKPIELKNDYDIEPFLKGKDHTSWQSFNPDIGKLTGRFMIIEDVIISHFVSENGAYSGCETLVQESANLYKNAGYTFKENDKLSSWSIKLSRIK